MRLMKNTTVSLSVIASVDNSVVERAPAVEDCHAKIYAGQSPERVVAQSYCVADDIDPLPVWLSTDSPTRIEVNYRTDFTTDYTAPRVDYVKDTPVRLGVTHAAFSISLPTTRSE